MHFVVIQTAKWVTQSDTLCILIQNVGYFPVVSHPKQTTVLCPVSNMLFLYCQYVPVQKALVPPPPENSYAHARAWWTHGPWKSVIVTLILDAKEVTSLSTHSDCLRLFRGTDGLLQTKQHGMGFADWTAGQQGVCKFLWIKQGGMGSYGLNSRPHKWHERQTHLSTSHHSSLPCWWF